MALDTYTNLKASILNWIARADLGEAQAGEFITLAESDFRARFGSLDDVTTGTVTTAPGVATLNLPATLRSLQALAHTASGSSPIRQVSSQELLESEDSKSSGKPRKFCFEGDTLVRLAPTPDAAYPLLAAFRRNFVPLSTDATRNWLLEDFPNIYLYGALMHAKVFMQEAEITTVTSMYQAATDAVTQHLRSRGSAQGSPSFYKSFL